MSVSIDGTHCFGHDTNILKQMRIFALQAEEANLPETMCRLSVGMRSVEELRALMRTAKDLMLNTPKSFRKILRSALYANLSQVWFHDVERKIQISDLSFNRRFDGRVGRRTY